jgi:hypothetical protein
LSNFLFPGTNPGRPNNFLVLILFALVDRLEQIAGRWRWRAQVQLSILLFPGTNSGRDQQFPGTNPNRFSQPPRVNASDAGAGALRCSRLVYFFLVLILDVTNNFLVLILFALVNRLERMRGALALACSGAVV